MLDELPVPKANSASVTQQKTEGGGDTPFKEIKPWHEEIDPAELLHDVANTIRRFIVCSQETANAAALWAAMTHFMDVVDVAPLAIITAPEMRCGKTQMLTALSYISCRPLTASNITAAALFRSIDVWHPTLFIDEADAFMRENEELRGLINCGHTRQSAYIIRTVGPEFKPKMFNVWSAKAISGIGHLAGTLMDRAIVLELRRKLPSELVDRLRHAEPWLWTRLLRKLVRFAQDRADDVRVARPTLPPELNDRAQDNWEPLMQIAEVVGGDWPTLARTAALKLSGDTAQSRTIGVELLADIQEVFETKRVDRISSAELIKALVEDEEKPWAGYNRGFPIKPAQVAKRLREYGISVNTIRLHGSTPKGYLKRQFVDAFARYLPSVPVDGEISATPTQGKANAGSPVAANANVADRSATGHTAATVEASAIVGCGGVAAMSVVYDPEGGIDF